MEVEDQNFSSHINNNINNNITNADKDAIRLWRVWKTVHQLCRDRGYTVNPEDTNISLQDFCAVYAVSGSVVNRSALNFVVSYARNNQVDRLMVFFPEDLSVGIKPIRSLLERMNEQAIQRAIIVYRQSMTPSATKVLSTMAPKYLLEQFAEAELVVNITEHVLVPQHIVLEEEEKRELLERYRLKETQLPRILVSDPVARYFGMRRGQVVKIVRPSETAGRYITYRLAV